MNRGASSTLRCGTGAYNRAQPRKTGLAAGLAHLFAMPMGGQVYLSIRFYLHGEEAPAVIERIEPVWQAWMKERFTPAGEAQGVA